MSTENIKKTLVEDLKKALSSEANKENRRRLLVASQPYVLYLQDLSFIDIAIEEFISKGRPANVSTSAWRDLKQVSNRYNSRGLSKAVSIAREAHEEYLNGAKIDSTQPGSISNNLAARTIKQKDPRTYTILGESAFLMNYGKIKYLKNKIVNALMSDEINPRLKTLIANNLDVGHGAGGGLAVSAINLAQGFQMAESSLREEGVRELRRVFQTHTWDALKKSQVTPSQLSTLIDLSIRYNQVVDDKGISANYIAHARYQLGKENRGTDRQLEGLLLNTTRSFFQGLDFQKILHLHGSSSLFEKVSSFFLKKFNKYKNIIVNSPYLNIILKTSGKARSKSYTEPTKGNIRDIPGIPIPVPDNTLSSNINLQTLIPIINEKLHDTIQSKMGSPRLNYRTGRFASTATVEYIHTLAGTPDIKYTYMKYPYQVFEYPPTSSQGRRLATMQRDPRLVIGESVREIASQYIAQYFTVTRF